MINKKVSKLEYLIPLAIGFVFFAFIFGLKPLNVNDISWIGGTDAMQNYLGWQFYRQSPWSFPIIGASPYFGMELGSSIVYSDSNPLLAIFFKIFSPVLPEKFQYFGIWLLLCCALQSLLIWKIISIFTTNKTITFLATLTLLFNPAWINRVGHINLIAHFLILTALYLIISGSEKKRKIKWGCLILISFSVHFYIALMVSIIWASNIISRIIFKKETIRKASLEFFLITSLSVCLMYCLGYFTVSGVSSPGVYGYFAGNLLSPITPNGWSYLLSGINLPESGFESFNFLGLGAIVLFVITIILTLKNKTKIIINEKSSTLIFSCLLFSILYTSNVVTIGKFSYKIDLPYQILDALSVARVSGRFFWPVTYIILISSAAYVISKLKVKSVYLILTLAAAIQIFDTSKGYNKDSFYFFKRQVSEHKLNSNFWSENLHDYEAIRYVPYNIHNNSWLDLSNVAEKAKISTDAVYLARFSGQIANEMNYKVVSELAFGKYKNTETYVIRDDLVNYVSLKDGDSIFKIDGFNVLAPGLKGCTGCSLVRQGLSRGIYVFESNWLDEQPMGLWNAGERTLILIKNNSPNNSIKISYNVYTPEQVRQQRLIFKINGLFMKEIIADRSGEVTLLWDNINKSGVSTLTIETPDAIEPRAVGLNDDARLISFAINSINFL